MPYPLDLTITGKPSPRTTERAGSARQTQRPLSANRAKSLRSNIFGGPPQEQTGQDSTRPKPRVKSAPIRNEREEKVHESAFKGASVISRSELAAVRSISDSNNVEPSDGDGHTHLPEGVPKLDLGNLVDKDNRLRNPIAGHNISVETPNSASSVSWGTPIQSGRPPSGKKIKGGGWQVNQSRVPNQVRSPKPKKHEDVPSLDLQLSQSNEGLKELAKVAKKVHEDIKIEYMGTPKHKQKSKKGIDAEDNSKPDEEEASSRVNETDRIEASLQLNKLGESKKKTFVEETLLVDQLSRATIAEKSAENTQSPESLDSKQKRHRDLFASSSPITGTSSDTSLLKRLRFGARILTRNGHDALREINGFFFPSDQTITMYEFRQFGTRSNALPFIDRGRYCHIKGPKKDRQFTILDIQLGRDLQFRTGNQASLPDSLKSKPIITFRITEFDAESKEKLLYDGCRSAKDRTERESWIANYDSSKERQQKELMLALRGSIQAKLKKRAVKTIINLGKHFRTVDKSGDGVIDREEFKEALRSFRIDIPEDNFNVIWQAIDTDGDGKLDYSEFLRGAIGEMSESRKALVRKAFTRLDTTKTGWTAKDNLKKFFSARKHPRVTAGEATEQEITSQFLSNFDETDKKGIVSFTEFESYYEGLSLQTETDAEFSAIMRSSWGV